MTTGTYTAGLARTEDWAQDEWAEESNGRGTREGERLAWTLGAFSVGLGLAQILAPQRLARAIGIDDEDSGRRTMRTLGFRELATGVGLLLSERPAAFAGGRVVGDAMDLVLLGSALTSRRNDRRRLAAALAAVAGVTALDIVASRQLGREEAHDAVHARPRERGIRVRKAITINRPAAEVYGFWRKLENLPRFMAHLESVRDLDPRRSYWKVRAPLGRTVEWTAEIVEDRPNELIAWRSVEESQIPNSGTVRFVPAPGGRGTEVHLDLRYDPPAGVLGATLARLFGREPAQQVDGDLRRLKQVLETGEVVHSDASIHRGPHPARPPEQVPADLAPAAPRDFAPWNGGFE